MRSRASTSSWVFGFLTSLALASPAFAQAPATQQPPPPPQTSTRSSGAEGFGIQLGGGPLFANFSDAQNLESKAGWLLGVLMGGNRGGTVGVEADVLYGKRGVTVPFFGDFDQSVIHVPVMLKINGGSSNVNSLSVFGVGGGYFDWQFGAKLGNVDISDDTNGYEVGWVIGGGVEVLRFSGQVRYMRGIRQVREELRRREFRGLRVESDCGSVRLPPQLGKAQTWLMSDEPSAMSRPYFRERPHRNAPTPTISTTAPNMIHRMSVATVDSGSTMLTAGTGGGGGGGAVPAAAAGGAPPAGSIEVGDPGGGADRATVRRSRRASGGADEPPDRAVPRDSGVVDEGA